jgi:pathogen-inducible salicylic acid glucosyltransferase
MLFTQSCAVDNIYYHVYKGVLKLPLSETEIFLPGSPPLQPQDMPSFIYDLGSYSAYFDMLVGQFSNVDKADWLLVNTFYELEEEVRACDY